MGKFELAVLAAIVRLRDDAYGRRLHSDLESRLGKTVPMGQIYVALARLEDKRLIASALGDPTAVRGGRAKRYYWLTADGERAFRAETTALRTLVFATPLPEVVS